ncbi:MAG TPA: 3D-(3,5/4)-trihydroxycyclohexane-1,2-dione acylhydrolase (decyclizing) [Steroidobacteraceae bacterium]|jgi:3D-(3,5/4)-trihydroxycyclohexane-1,2-dione acylhydrolase (decyclizing)|nr:3D-(3,5/4)-trihydroxycyclohexane-1,2-dione acylhydrolase (decyclizing) [Steroidobacteraceae bacterium]
MARMRLTAAQAAVRYLANQHIAGEDGPAVRYFAGAWAIFGHGNVAGLGEALHAAGKALPTFRAHNEQSMAHAAIAFAKASRRRRAMICTSSIGPGALNMVTAAAVAHVNRLPVLFLPGDVFAGRGPDPVLQQVEDFADGTVSANDCFRPVSRYFDRIQRPEQLLEALPRAMATLLEPAGCGPVTLAFCQDTQTEAWDFPAQMMEPATWSIRRPPPTAEDLRRAAECLRSARSPLIIAGGGVLYSAAEAALDQLARATGIPVAETQAGRGTLSWEHPQSLGAIGVTGTSAANATAAAADVVLAVGTRLQDFTTASRTLFAKCTRFLQVNVSAYDAHKHGSTAIVGDAREVLLRLREAVADYRVPQAWSDSVAAVRVAWDEAWNRAVRPPEKRQAVPSDAQVIGAVCRWARNETTVVCAAGGLPGELHKLWRPASAAGYHVEYGFSCMGYEIAGGLGVKLAEPDREVVVMVGDGSYLMLNSEIATSVMLGLKLAIVVLDNRGFGCINRLQKATGGAPFNNLLADSRQKDPAPVDFAAHAAALGAQSEKVADVGALSAALERARASSRTYVIVIETDPQSATDAGGAWWDVAVPEVSVRDAVRAARAEYERRRKTRWE